MKSIRTAILLALCAAFSAFGGTYKPDSSHTDVAFKIRHLGLSKVRGHFETYTGSIHYDGKPESLKIEAVINIDSIDTGNEKRDEHLLNADFFDAPKHPTMTFKSSGVKKSGDGYQLAGTMTIKGVSKPVLFDLAINGPVDSPFEPGVKIIGIDLQGELKRHDFGVSNDQGSDKLIGDTVHLEISIEAKQ